MISLPSQFSLRLPGWADSLQLDPGLCYATHSERMEFVLGLVLHNIENGTGGPFAAAVFEIETGRLFSFGVNVVEASNCSHAHAEMMALGLAQQRAGTWNLSKTGLPSLQLVSSAEPCAMCFGAIPWSGIRSLVYGARCSDTEQFGFDEGEKSSAWAHALQKRGIEVIPDVLRDQARQLFEEYLKKGGMIYNPLHPST